MTTSPDQPSTDAAAQRPAPPVVQIPSPPAQQQPAPQQAAQQAAPQTAPVERTFVQDLTADHQELGVAAPPSATALVQRIATSPIDVQSQAPAAAWVDEPPIRKGLGGSALLFSFAGLSASFFVGWAFPIGIVGIITGILAVRRTEEDTVSGGWAIALGILALGYSAFWLVRAASLGWI